MKGQLKSEQEKFGSEQDQFKSEEKYKALMELYNEKCEELRVLGKNYTDLQHEYSENTIVQSMNAMKEQYEDLMASTVPKFRYDLVNERLDHLNRILTTCSVILEHATTGVKNITERFLYDGQNKLQLQKVGFELSILTEILIEYETERRD